MTKEIFLSEIESNRKSLVEAFGGFLYFFSLNILGLCKIEKQLEEKGYTVKRITNAHQHSAHTEVYFNDKQIAHVEMFGNFPSIEFYKGYKKHAEKFLNEEYIIAPIQGVHRILDWHTVEKEKLHCLAGGETVLHFKPFQFTVEEVAKFLKDTKLDQMIEKSKATTPESLKK